MNELPKITLVTPVFNQRDLLEACINSVLSQDYPNLEYIVMDGGSTDGSVEVIKENEKNLTYWQSQRDAGPYAAVNEGFRKSTGQIMGWLNADDMLHRDGLLNIASAFIETPEAEWIEGRRVAFSANGIQTEEMIPLMSWTREKLLNEDNFKQPYCLVMQEATFWRRSLWERCGSYLDLNFSLAADFELWARFSRTTKLYQLNAKTGGFRDHSTEQRSKKFWDSYVVEAFKVIEREREIAVPEEIDDRPARLLTLKKDEITTPTILPAKVRTSTEKPPAWSGHHFAIFTIVLDDKSYLRQCIESVHWQQCQNLEHYIFDVGPSKESGDVIEEYKDIVKSINVESLEGLVGVLESCINSSKADVINIAPVSTMYDPYGFRMVSVLFDQNPAISWLNGKFQAYDDQGEEFFSIFSRPFSRKFFLKGNFYDPFLQLETVFFRKSLWDQAGGYLDKSF